MNKIYFVLIFLLIGCSATVKPSEELLRNADYEESPNLESLESLARNFIKTDRQFYDPNGAEIERCTKPRKSWANEWDYYYDSNTNEYIFTWEFNCHINGKNRLGGFIGFDEYKFIYHRGKVVNMKRDFGNNTIWGGFNN